MLSVIVNIRYFLSIFILVSYSMQKKMHTDINSDSNNDGSLTRAILLLNLYGDWFSSYKPYEFRLIIMFELLVAKRFQAITLRVKYCVMYFVLVLIATWIYGISASMMKRSKMKIWWTRRMKMIIKGRFYQKNFFWIIFRALTLIIYMTNKVYLKCEQSVIVVPFER